MRRDWFGGDDSSRSKYGTEWRIDIRGTEREGERSRRGELVELFTPGGVY